MPGPTGKAGGLVRRVVVCDIDGDPIGAAAGSPSSSSVTWSAAASVAMDSSWTSDAISLGVLRYWSIDFSWTGAGSPVGILSVEVSNGLSWNEVPESVTNVSGAGSVLWTDRAADYLQVRVVYVRTSGGSGDTGSATFVSKG